MAGIFKNTINLLLTYINIQTKEWFSGIPFDNSQQALNAILLYLADCYHSVEREGRGLLSLLDTSDSISFITSFRLNKFIKELKTDDGEAYASYDPHNSPISSLEILITKAPNGKSILYITPDLTNTKDYEARIIKLLNKPPLKGNLEPHFTNRNYERIQQSADIKISGTERELDKISEVLQTSMGFEYVTLSSIEGYWKSQSRKFTLPANTVQEKKLLAPYEVKIYISDFYYSRREIGISFRHPEAQELMYYQGRYLNNARNTFRRSLEASLSK